MDRSVDRCAGRHDGAEQRHAADQLDLAVDESGAQLASQIVEVIVPVVDHAQAIQQRVHQSAASAIRHTVINERVAEDPGAGSGERGDRVEDLALVRETSGEAVNDAAERDRIEGTSGDPVQWLQNIANIRARFIARQPPSRIRETVRLQVDQRQSRIWRWETPSRRRTC